jgi:hypothetical protein
MVHPLAERSLAENEKVWLALSSEFDAATDELRRCMQAIEDNQMRGDYAAFERAKQRWQIVQTAMLTFLDALD